MIAMYVSICVHSNPYYVASCSPRPSFSATMTDAGTHALLKKWADDLKDFKQWGHAFQSSFISVNWMDKLHDEYGELRAWDAAF